MLSMAEPGATFLLNSPYGPDEVWDHLPAEVQQQIIAQEAEVLRGRRLRAWPATREMGVRINTVMQTCFFKLAKMHSARGGDRRTSRSDQEDLRQEGRRHDRRAELRRGRRGPGRRCTR